MALPCGCEWDGREADPKGPVYWNEFNGVVQCHKCGETYAPAKKVRDTEGERARRREGAKCGWEIRRAKASR